jgi:hypothetical protein
MPTLPCTLKDFAVFLQALNHPQPSQTTFEQNLNLEQQPESERKKRYHL